MAAATSSEKQQYSLSGKRVLVIEDEYYIADDLRRALAAAGAHVIGPAGTVFQALEAIAAGGFDCAVIDLNLHGESAVAVAEKLSELGARFAIATGYGSTAVPERFKHLPRFEKPFDALELVKLVAVLCGSLPDS